MTRPPSNDLDYLATRLHARRSRMAEAERLEALCQLRNLPELGRAVCPGAEFSTVADFQRRLLQDLVQELSGCLKHLAAEDQDLVVWLLARFQVENVKVLLRGFLNHTPVENLLPRLVPLPSGLAMDAAALLAAKSLEEFVRLLPPGSPRNRLQAVMANQREPTPFLLEAALDAGYFQELLARSNRLRHGESEIVKPLIAQEVNLFQFMLVVRGKFHFGLSPEALLPLRVSGSGDGQWLNTVLSASDVLAAAKSVVGVVIDALPAAGRSGDEPFAIEASVIEALAWQRYLRLANGAFRRSHMGVAAVAGYFGVRRVEIANLITLSESIRLGVDERQTLARLIPRTDLEVANV